MFNIDGLVMGCAVKTRTRRRTVTRSKKTCQRPGPWVNAKSRTETHAQLRLVDSIYIRKARRATTLLPSFSMHARNRHPVLQRRYGTQATLKPGCRTIAVAMGSAAAVLLKVVSEQAFCESCPTI
jgi:hypothetical protein